MKFGRIDSCYLPQKASNLWMANIDENEQQFDSDIPNENFDFPKLFFWFPSKDS